MIREKNAHHLVSRKPNSEFSRILENRCIFLSNQNNLIGSRFNFRKNHLVRAHICFQGMPNQINIGIQNFASF